MKDFYVFSKTCPFPLFLPQVLFSLCPLLGLAWKPAAGPDAGRRHRLSSFFRALALLKLLTGLHFHIYSEFRHTSKNFEGGPQNIFQRKTLFSEKRVSKYGHLTVLNRYEAWGKQFLLTNLNTYYLSLHLPVEGRGRPLSSYILSEVCGCLF